jgi:hypothetical protein
LIASKYLGYVSPHYNKDDCKKECILLGLFVELLRLFLQLGKSALGIDIDGILCDLTLHTPLLAQAYAFAGAGALLKLLLDSSRMVDVRY